MQIFIPWQITPASEEHSESGKSGVYLTNLQDKMDSSLPEQFAIDMKYSRGRSWYLLDLVIAPMMSHKINNSSFLENCCTVQFPVSHPNSINAHRQNNS